MADEYEESPQERLMEGVFTGDLAVVERAIADGADVTLSNDIGMSPLLMAANTGPVEVVNALLKAGAVASTPDADGWTALTYAASTGYASVVTALLDADKSVIDAATGREGWTPFLRAAYRGSVDAMKALVEAGCDTAAKTVGNKSALQLAQEAEREEAVEYLKSIDKESA